MTTQADLRVQATMNEAAAEANEWAAENLALGGVCDFCSTPLRGRPPTTFIARTIVQSLSTIDADLGTGGIDFVQDPYWAACPPCAEAIDRFHDDAAGLAAYVIENRCVERVGEYPADIIAVLQADLADLYEALFENDLRREDP